MRSDWNFDTVKTMSALGTYRGTVNDLLPSAMVPEENESFDDTEVHGSIDSENATRGSDPILGIGMNLDAAHSTVVIKPHRSPEPVDPSDEAPSGTFLYSMSCSTDLTLLLGAPPAYSGSVHSGRRASYAARTSVDGTGTVLRPADLGTGVDTIRPVKKVDPVSSLRLSSEFVGSLRKDGSPASPTSPTAPRRTSSETARAGGLMVDEVILPILSNVRSPTSFSLKSFTNMNFLLSRLSEMTWMPARLNL